MLLYGATKAAKKEQKEVSPDWTVVSDIVEACPNKALPSTVTTKTTKIELKRIKEKVSVRKFIEKIVSLLLRRPIFVSRSLSPLQSWFTVVD